MKEERGEFVDTEVLTWVGEGTVVGDVGGEDCVTVVGSCWDEVEDDGGCVEVLPEAAVIVV